MKKLYSVLVAGILLLGASMLPMSASADQTLNPVTFTGFTSGSTVAVGTPVTFTATAADLDTPTFSVSDSSFIGTSVTGSEIDSSTGAFSWTPVAGDTGAHTLTVNAIDNSTGSTTQGTIDVTIGAAPIIPCTTGVPSTGLDVDVTQNITNDPDSGDFGGNWANDNFTRHIQIWHEGTQYCAEADDSGTFTSFGGPTDQSPESGALLPEVVTGSFTGSTHGEINGTFSTATPVQTTVDCGGADAGLCTAGLTTDWTQKYFGAAVDYSYAWGWTYGGGANGTWVNASTGNSGDIVYVAPSVVYVDGTNGNDSNDGSQAHPFATIHKALGTVNAGGTIHLAAGTYAVQVGITKSLTLVGAGTDSTFIQAPATLPANGAIINIDGSGVHADVSNLTVEGPGPAACGSISAGIYVFDSADASLHDMAVNDIQDSALSGCQNGRAILIGWGHGGSLANSAATATINNVSVANYQKAGIEVSGAGSSATVTNNTITGVGPTAAIAANGIEITFGASATVTGNTVSANTYTGGAGACAGDGSTANKTDYEANCDTGAGILLYQVGSGTDVEHNTVTSSQISVSISGGSTSAVHYNSITGSSLYALDTDSAVHASLNYWGAVTSPVANGFIEAGTLAGYSPWYTDAAMTTLNTTTTSNPDGSQSTTILGNTTQTGTSTENGSVDVSVSIPSGTTITGDSSWDGMLEAPTATTATVTIPGFDTTVSSAIELGSTLSDLTFDKAVKIVFAGEAGQAVGWFNHAGTFAQITNACADNTQVTNDGLVAGSDCQLTVGSDLVVWTKHFTTFVTYSQTLAPLNGGGSSGSSGGGNGGSSSTISTGATTGSIGGGQVLGASAFNFDTDLTIGSTGDAVTALQQVLISAGFLQIAAPTGYFGTLTQAAVKLYQSAHGISATGYVGPLTRAALNTGTITTADQEAHDMLVVKIKAALADVLAKLQTIQATLAARMAAGQN